MMDVSVEYSKGDWVVHTFYGVGRIKGTEIKAISGEKTRYYRIESSDCTYWIPVDEMDTELMRPLSTSTEIEEAIAALKREPKEMSSNHTIRKSRIQRVKLKNSPQATARLIRDLRARQKAKGALNQNERSAFKSLKQQLAEEWAVVSGTKTEKTISTVDHLLQRQLRPEK